MTDDIYEIVGKMRDLAELLSEANTGSEAGLHTRCIRAADALERLKARAEAAEKSYAEAYALLEGQLGDNLISKIKRVLDLSALRLKYLEEENARAEAAEKERDWLSNAYDELKAKCQKQHEQLVKKTDALEQVKTACIDNWAETVRHDLALKFVGEVAAKALTDELHQSALLVVWADT